MMHVRRIGQHQRLSVDHAAPDFELADHFGRRFRLSSADPRWRLLIFLRHRH